jgi:pimeloyl-ACP methyl ester carboxylesterase
MGAPPVPRRELQVRRRGGTLHVVDEGPVGAPPIVLVHGYPDDHRVWDGVAQRLAQRWRVIRYDVRGAGASMAPRLLARYRMQSLTGDLIAVLDATCGTTPAHLVGHDWGGIQAWDAISDPRWARRFRTFTTFSGPCLDHIALSVRSRARSAEERRQRLRQIAMSWYVYLFHLPRFAPALWRSGLAVAWPTLVQTLESGAYRDTMSTEERASAGARGVALYRANILPRLFRPNDVRPRVPVQFVWPRGDLFVGEAYVNASEPFIDRFWKRTVDGTHWIVALEPDRCARWIEELCTAYDDGQIETFRDDLRVSPRR